MGGAERAALNVACLLADCGNELVVMPTFSGGGVGSFYPVSDAISVRYLADLGCRRTAFSRLLALRRFIIGEKFDVVISFITNVNVAAIIAVLGRGTPVIVCERSDPFVIPISSFWRVARMLTYPFARRVVIQTQELLEKFENSYATYRNKLTVIPNAIPEIFQKEKVAVVNSRRVIAVGRLSKEKQFDHLIKAFSYVASRDGWTLEIVGEGDEREDLQALVDALGLQGQVFLLPAREDIENFYEPGCIFCLTSAFEGFPNALLEAMVSGCAPVCYESPCGPKEMLDNGSNGILVELNDVSALARGLQKLMMDDSLRVKLGAASARFSVEKFSSDVVLKKWLSALVFDD